MSGMENAYALVVGVANYQAVTPLGETMLNDAQDVAAFLADSAGGGYPSDNVRLLRDGEATRQALVAGLAWLAEASDEASNVVVFFSGHGARLEGGPYAGEYLLPVDVSLASDADLAATALAGGALTAALRAIPARKVLAVLDCCHAAGIGQPKAAAGAALKAGLSAIQYERLAEGRGRVILASSDEAEFSWVLPGDRNSLFTRHFLAGLRGGVESEDGFVRVFGLFEYVQPRVTAERRDQHPVFKGDLRQNFPVALYRGGQRDAIPRADDGYRYDAYITFANVEPDASWVWGTLVPRLRDAGLRIAVSGQVEERGVALVVGVERAVEQSRRVVAVITEPYLTGAWSSFQAVLALNLSVQERSARLLPLVLQEDLLDSEQRGLGPRASAALGALWPINVHQRYIDPLAQLVETLKAPLAPAFSLLRG